MMTIITLILIPGNTAPSTQTHTFQVETLPLVGDTFLWTGLLRLWIIGLVVVPVITYFLFRPRK